jgi:hypothetical protein
MLKQLGKAQISRTPLRGVAQMDAIIRKNAAPGGLRNARTMYWAIARHKHNRLDLFEARIGGVDVLPVFSSEEQAEAFLLSQVTGEWETRPTGVGELISLLSDPYRHTTRVALDPPPEAMDETVLVPVGVGQQVFLDSLLGRGRGWFEDSLNARTDRPAKHTA